MEAIVNMACGLANRMFQYSYYLYLKKRGWQVTVDFYRKSKLPHENVDWEHIFPNAKIEQASKLKVLIKGGGPMLYLRFADDIYLGLRKSWKCQRHLLWTFPRENGQYMMGVFQNADMVESVRDEILKAFAFHPFSGGENFHLMNEMLNNKYSVGIHVRKGKDYTKRVLYQNTCSIEYYKMQWNI